jgi:hypothetical protein
MRKRGRLIAELILLATEGSGFDFESDRTWWISPLGADIKKNSIELLIIQTMP